MSEKLESVKIVGAGLLGTSLGLALRRKGISVLLADSSKTNLRLAIEYGAGSAEIETEPQLVVVCTPPETVSEIIANELLSNPNAVVTDVASVKQAIVDDLADNPNQTRYLGSHPMAGRERGGPASAQADLFFARPWIVTPTKETDSKNLDLIRQLVDLVEATWIELDPMEHDKAMAVVSHLPQLVASLVASKLAATDENKLQLSGQGLRDVTRIASSDPELWAQIISRNSHQIAPVLSEMSFRLAEIAAAVSDIEAPGSLRAIHKLISEGNQGVSRIPGKHGGKHRGYQTVTVMVDDKPGELARLLTEIGEIGVNLEDLRLEHSPGAQIGLAELDVLPTTAQLLISELQNLGWRLA